MQEVGTVTTMAEVARPFVLRGELSITNSSMDDISHSTDNVRLYSRQAATVIEESL
jgi:hypothetical protein